jgi:hypothetical protein
MIELFDGYLILVDAYNYVLAKKMGETKRKDGSVEPKYKVYGYYGSVSDALECLAGVYVREGLKDGTHTLTQALNTIKESNGKVAKLIEGIKE